MEKIKFSVFDIFAYLIPGGFALFAAIVCVDPSIVQLVDLLRPFQGIDLSLGLVAIVVAYVVGFAVDSPASWLYYSIGCRIFGRPYKMMENELSNSQKRALVRQFSPENFSYVQLWKTIKTMSHNLSMSFLILAISFAVRSIQVPVSHRIEWIILAAIMLLLSAVFLHRAHVFDTWSYNDLSNAVQTLHLERRSLKEVSSESGDEEPIDITILT